MNISTLAKILGVSINELRDTGTKERIFGFSGRNTRIPYTSAVQITKVLRPEKASQLENDDRVYLPQALTVGEFSEAIGKPAGMVVKTLLMNGVMATLNEKIDYDTANLIAEELGVEVFLENGSIVADSSAPQDLQLMKTFDVSTDTNEANLISRPPIVTVMGHVDHGKTTLLDTIRKTKVAATEAGAITQHISSYQIDYEPEDKELGKTLVRGKNGYKITFVDTPGHEAFTAMRARGTQLADIIILMVSAVEGPKPQTVEVIERAKLSKTPMIVALNKIDLPNSDVEKAKQEIAAFGIVPEEWGGDTPFIPISAKNGTNINKILDAILLMAEVSEYKGKINCAGQAVVMESVLDQKVGPQATVLVTRNKLVVGDFISCGEMIGKIKKINSSAGIAQQEAHLAEPVEIYGLPEVARIGDLIIVYPSQKDAQNAVNLEKVKKAGKKQIVHQNDTNQDVINVIIKADVSGSLEALKESILKIPQEQTKIIIKQESIGQVNENDVNFAKTTDSTILAFHTNSSTTALNLIKSQKVNLIESDIIYELLEWLEEQLLKRIKHEVRIDVIGHFEVLALFKSEKSSIQVFGGEVKDGKILSNKMLRLMRNGEDAGRLEILELQRNKSKVSEVNISQQFGLSVTGKVKIQKGDIIECIDEVVLK